MSDSASQLFSIPQAYERSSLRAYKSSVSAAQDAIKVAKEQIACLELEDLFEEHPELTTLILSGEEMSDDEGGCYWRLCVDALMDADASDGRAMPWSSGQCESIAQDILEEWAPEIDGIVITREDYAQKMGRVIMGEEEFAQWQAQRAKFALEAEVPDSAPRGKGGPRV